MRKIPLAAALTLALLVPGQTPAIGRASVQVTGAWFRIDYGVATSTRFTVVGDGKVTVTSRATGGGIYLVQVQRENCGFWGCHGYKLVGDRRTLTADGITRTVTLSPGNNNLNHKIWISKPDDSRYIEGTISFR